jgi:hypothetical protein
LLAQELSGGRIVNYGWDANGNMTSLVPPGRPSHGFAYDAVDLNSQYVAPPPASGQPASTTVYEYDLEKNLRLVTRPDNAQVVITRDPTIGRVTTLTHPVGVSRFAYWDTPQPGSSQHTGKPKSITRESTPDTVAVSFGYDGPLLTSETWSGAVPGQVEHARPLGLGQPVTVAGDSPGHCHDNHARACRWWLSSQGNFESPNATPAHPRSRARDA